MTPEALAALHATSFTDTPRPWSAAEFAAVLALPGTLVASRPGGFALGRVAGPEAELLTLAVHPAARRRGLATAARRRLRGPGGGLRGAEECLLEVAVEQRRRARALRRARLRPPPGGGPATTARADAGPVDALVLRKRPITAAPKNHLTDSGR